MITFNTHEINLIEYLKLLCFRAILIFGTAIAMFNSVN